MRRYEPFMFKHFKVHQQESAMKVGTDAVLLGAYVSVPADRPIRVLDVGSGTGIVGLMVAQRSPMARVTCVELSEEAVRESLRSISESPFFDRVEAVCSDFLDYTPEEHYDLIISNPPFFTETHQALGKHRNQARHIGGLTPEGFFGHARKYLRPDGRVVVITAVSSFDRFRAAADEHSLFLQAVLLVRPLRNAPVKRVVATWGLDAVDSVELDDLFIEVARHHYSGRFGELTKDFYLTRK